MLGQRGISTLPAVFLAAFAGLVFAVFLSDWVIIDVETKGADQVHIVVPLPLMMADVAAALIPAETFEDAKIPADLVQHREAVMNSLECLLDCPDATFVRVKSQDTRVSITKRGDTLLIDVDADDAQVTCNIPIDGIHEALGKWDWQTFDLGLLLDVLREADRGSLVKVEAEDAHVAISMW